MKITYLLIAFLFTLNTTTQGGNLKKFGDIQKEDFLPTNCPIDNDASAYFIFDEGFVNYEIIDKHVLAQDPSMDKSRFGVNYERHYKIKICSKSAIDKWGNISIPLFQGSNPERVESFSGAVYNIEGGKIESSKMNFNDLLSEEINSHLIEKKIALPNLKVGSIIEIKYIISSIYIGKLQDWNFQHSIPVMHSQFEIRIPDLFEYDQRLKGKININTKTNKLPKNETITYEDKGYSQNSPAVYNVQNITYNDNVTIYTKDSLSAFEDDNFTRSSKNSRSRLTCEIKSSKMPHSIIHYYNTNWTDIINDLLDDANYGKAIAKTNSIDVVAAQIKAKKLSEIDRMNACFEAIKSRMTWNKENGLYSKDKNLNSNFIRGSGNASEINLTLVALLKSAKLEAYPVALSTTDNGFIDMKTPSKSDFNYTIAIVYIDTNYYLFDATQKHHKPNFLPLRILNEEGLVIKPKSTVWIPLKTDKKYELEYNSSYTLNNELKLLGEHKLSGTDYGAYEIASYARLDDAKTYINSEILKEVCSECSSDITIDTADWKANNTISFNFKTKMQTKSSNNLIIKPQLIPFFNKNPFPQKERTNDIEFQIPINIKSISSITIPKEYSIGELPKPTMIKFEDGSAMYTSNTTIEDNILWITSTFYQNGSTYSANNFATLKQFFQSIINQQNEVLLLKKN